MVLAYIGDFVPASKGEGDQERPAHPKDAEAGSVRNSSRPFSLRRERERRDSIFPETRSAWEVGASLEDDLFEP